MENKPFLTTRSLQPENQESPIHFLSSWLTPDKYFYRRNHFSYPVLTSKHLWLQISGNISQPRFFHLYEMISLPVKSLILPLECAGNKRAHFHPKVYGEQWEDGAISQGKWTGVPLFYLLEQTGFSKNTKEIVFEGADFGRKPNKDNMIPYRRSLPLEKALHPDTIIAYQYNNKSLDYKHGYPFRLIVPNWYGMASVKWLNKIEIIDHSFEGPFQTEDYVYYPHKNNDQESYPVTTLHVNSIIQQPLPFTVLNTGIHKIKGIAWTGKGVVTEIEVSLNNGDTWKQAVLERSNDPYAWTKWFLLWHAEKKGEYSIYVRAKDSHGRVQPLQPFWNRMGYGYNAVSKVNVKIE